MPLLELTEAQVELENRQLRVECQRLPIRRCGLWKFLEFGKHRAQTCKGSSILGIATGDCNPGLRGFVEFSLLFERDSVGGLLGGCQGCDERQYHQTANM